MIYNSVNVKLLPVANYRFPGNGNREMLLHGSCYTLQGNDVKAEIPAPRGNRNPATSKLTGNNFYKA
jgi:hypothetical protein